MNDPDGNLPIPGVDHIGDILEEDMTEDEAMAWVKEWADEGIEVLGRMLAADADFQDKVVTE